VTGLDTNVLVRYLAKDDRSQSLIASQIINNLTPESPGFISQVALMETVWVLSRSYKMPRAAIAEVLDTLLHAGELVVEDAEISYLALATYRATKVDFADALIAHGGLLAGCQKTLTFDQAAADVPGMQILETTMP